MNNDEINAALDKLAGTVRAYDQALNDERKLWNEQQESGGRQLLAEASLSVYEVVHGQFSAYGSGILIGRAIEAARLADLTGAQHARALSWICHTGDRCQT